MAESPPSSQPPQWPPPPPTPKGGLKKERKEEKDAMALAMSELMKSLTRWWEASTQPEASSEQPVPMTYEEVMQCAPRRRAVYDDALDDASSSGDEGDVQNDDDQDDPAFFDHGNLDKVMALHQGLVGSRATVHLEDVDDDDDEQPPAPVKDEPPVPETTKDDLPNQLPPDLHDEIKDDIDEDRQQHTSSPN